MMLFVFFKTQNVFNLEMHCKGGKKPVNEPNLVVVLLLTKLSLWEFYVHGNCQIGAIVSIFGGGEWWRREGKQMSY